MHRPNSPLTCLILAASVSVIGNFAVSGERLALPETPVDQIAGLVSQLEHPEFAVREEASRQLLAAGVETIPPLVETSLAGPPEAATRALQVLEGHLLNQEPTTFETADEALQRLAESEKGTVAVGAASILSRHSQLREERAVAVIRELGATVTYDVDGSDSQQWRGAVIWGPGDQTEPHGLRPRDVVIGSDWTGGTEGLKYLRRLSHWRDIKLYVVRASGVPLAEAEKLAAVLPGLEVQERGAYLGISSSRYNNPDICVVGGVLPDGPAGQAGLKERDIVHELNGQPVEGFDDLIEKLKDRAPGERVAMTVYRNDFQSDKSERLTVNVELGKWELPSLTDQAERFLKQAAESKAEQREARDDNPDDRDPVPTEAFPTFER